MTDVKKMAKNGKKPDPVSFRIVKIIVCIIFAVYSFSLIVPVIWALIVSVADPFWFLFTGFAKMPTQFDLSNYVRTFDVIYEVSGLSFEMMIINSIWWAVGGALLSVIVSNITAYACARYNFVGGKVLYWVAVIGMMIPIASNTAPLFKLCKDMNIVHTPLMLLTQMGGLGFNFIVIYSAYKGISGEYAEAAFMDGAGHLRVFLSIYFPMSISSMIALGLMQFIGLWGDPQFPLLFLDGYENLASGLYLIENKLRFAEEESLEPIFYAALMISTIPSITLFMIFRKKFMDMQISGGIKG